MLAYCSDVLFMKRPAPKIFPKLQKFWEKTTSHVHRSGVVDNDPNSELLKKVITGDESLMYGYDIETKDQSYQWKCPEEARPKNRKIEKGAVGDIKKRISEVFQELEKTLA